MVKKNYKNMPLEKDKKGLSALWGSEKNFFILHAVVCIVETLVSVA